MCREKYRWETDFQDVEPPGWRQDEMRCLRKRIFIAQVALSADKAIGSSPPPSNFSQASAAVVKERQRSASDI